jgi:hypothetical protein
MSEFSFESKDSAPLIAQGYPAQGFAPQDQQSWLDQKAREAADMAQASRRHIVYPKGANLNQGGDQGNYQANDRNAYRQGDQMPYQNNTQNPEDRDDVIGLMMRAGACLQAKQINAARQAYEHAIEQSKQINPNEVRQERARAEAYLKTETNPSARKELENKISEYKFLERGPGVIMAYYGESLIRNGFSKEGEQWINQAHRADPTLKKNSDYLRKLPELAKQYKFVDMAVDPSDISKATDAAKSQAKNSGQSERGVKQPERTNQPAQAEGQAPNQAVEQAPDLAQAMGTEPVGRPSPEQGIPGLDYDPGLQVENEPPVILRDNVLSMPNFDDPYGHLAKAKAALVKTHGVISKEVDDEYTAALNASQRLELGAINAAIAKTKEALSGSQSPKEQESLKAELKRLDDLRVADCKISLSYAELLIKQNSREAAQKYIDRAAAQDDSAFYIMVAARRLTSEAKGSVVYSKPFFEAGVKASDIEALRQTKTDHKVFSDYPQLISRAHYAIALNRSPEPATHFQDSRALIIEIKSKGFNGINDTKLACRLAEIEYASKVGVKLPTDVFEREIATESLAKFTDDLRRNWVNARNFAAEGKLNSAADSFGNVNRYIDVLDKDKTRGTVVLGEKLKLIQGILLNSKDKENIHYFPVSEPMRHQYEAEAKAIKELLVLRKQAALSSLEFYNHEKILRSGEAKDVLKREQATMNNGLPELAGKSKTFLDQQAHIIQTLNNQALIKEQIASCKRHADQNLSGTTSSLAGVFTASAVDAGLSKFPVTRAMPMMARLATSVGLGGVVSGFTNKSILSMDKTNKNNNDLGNFAGAAFSNMAGITASMLFFKGFRPANPTTKVLPGQVQGPIAPNALVPNALVPVAGAAKTNPFMAKMLDAGKVLQAKAQPSMDLAASLWGKFANMDEGRFAATSLSAGTMAAINEGGRNLARVSNNEMNPFTKKPYTLTDAMTDTSVAFATSVVSGMAASKLHNRMRTPGKVVTPESQALSTARWATGASSAYTASRVVHANMQDGPMKAREKVMDAPLEDYDGPDESQKKRVKLSDDPLGLGTSSSGIDLTEAVKDK